MSQSMTPVNLKARFEDGVVRLHWEKIILADTSYLIEISVEKDDNFTELDTTFENYYETEVDEGVFFFRIKSRNQKEGLDDSEFSNVSFIISRSEFDCITEFKGVINTLLVNDATLKSVTNLYIAYQNQFNPEKFPSIIFGYNNTSDDTARTSNMSLTVLIQMAAVDTATLAILRTRVKALLNNFGYKGRALSIHRIVKQNDGGERSLALEKPVYTTTATFKAKIKDTQEEQVLR